MKIFMVRHGETDYNVAKRIQGQEIDQSLNATGRKQAEACAEAISKMKVDVIFSSPLKRARETAEIIAKKFNRPVLYRDELKERSFGSLGGKTFEEVNASIGTDWNELTSDKDAEYFELYKREPTENFKKRLLAFIGEVKRDYAGKQVLIIAHKGLIRLAHLLFRETHVAHIENAAIEEFEI